MFLNLGELCVNCIIVLPDMKCHVCVRIIYYGCQIRRVVLKFSIASDATSSSSFSSFRVT